MQTRRRVISGVAGAAAAGMVGWSGARAAITPRCRVIIDNDFAGDPDGLFQLAHHVLSPSVSIPLIIASHLHRGETWTGGGAPARDGAAKATELLTLMKLERGHTVFAGSESALAAGTGSEKSAATAAIIAEAMRTDATTPLYYAAGGGLTELAAAWLAEPRIGRRLKLVWIGGGEHAGLATPPPGGQVQPEYNLTIDMAAAKVVFNQSDIEIWQVPRDVYRQMLFSSSELDELAASSGALGGYLKAQVDRVIAGMERAPIARRQSLGETYVLGDSPLVTLTALQSSFQPDPSSSRYVLMPTPKLNDAGAYEPGSSGRAMRVYTAIDTRLTFADMAWKFRAFARQASAAP